MLNVYQFLFLDLTDRFLPVAGLTPETWHLKPLFAWGRADT